MFTLFGSMSKAVQHLRHEPLIVPTLSPLTDFYYSHQIARVSQDVLAVDLSAHNL